MSSGVHTAHSIKSKRKTNINHIIFISFIFNHKCRHGFSLHKDQRFSLKFQEYYVNFIMLEYLWILFTEYQKHEKQKKCCFFSCRIENLTSKCNTHCNDSFLREVNMFAQMACFSIDSVRKSSFHLVLIKLSAYSGSKLYFLWRSQLALQPKFFFIVTFLHFSFHVVSWSDVDNEIISRIMNYWSYITVAFYIYKKKEIGLQSKYGTNWASSHV